MPVHGNGNFSEAVKFKQEVRIFCNQAFEGSINGKYLGITMEVSVCRSLGLILEGALIAPGHVLSCVRTYVRACGCVSLGGWV